MEKSSRPCSRDECENLISASADYRTRFCSRSCSAKVNNSKYPKRPNFKRVKSCMKCGGELSYNQKKYCSHRCAHSHRRDNYISMWLAGEVSGSNSNGSMSKRVRGYLLERASFRCTSPECSVPGGWGIPNRKTGEVILTIDHIDGNWQNNSVDNLIVLCYNCHTLTDTFGSLNRGNQLVEGTRRDSGMVGT